MEFQFEQSLREAPFERLPKESQLMLARAEIFETLRDEVEGLRLAENSEIIDRIIGEKDASENLIGNLRAFSKKLAEQEAEVVMGSSAEDMLKCTETCLLAFVDRIKKHGPKEMYERFVRESFYSTKEYLELLNKSVEFEKAELGSRLGFLKDLITDEELEQLVTQKVNYVKKCKEVLGIGGKIN